MKRVLKWIGIVVAAVFVAIQFVPVSRENPADGQPFDATKEVQDVLRRACFDCHSNETVWPWYAYVAPASWLVAHDVEEGREHLNFSYFAAYSADKRGSKAEEMIEELERGNMPPAPYLLLHSDARPSAQEIGVLRKWAADL